MDDGGPALSAGYCDKTGEVIGLSIRDYFAAHALIHMGPVVTERMRLGRDAYEPFTVASMCYELADALLAVRAKS